MARRGFRIHSSARFNPFSYQELIAPLQEYEQAYGQMQDAMLTLGEEANQYKQLVDTDEYASGVLKGYNDALAEMSGTLSTQGLKSVNRNSLIGLRRRYNDEVKPVNDAAKTLAGIQDMYRQAYAKDPTMMKGAMPTIKGLIDNPGAMPHMVSGSSLYSQGNQAAKNASGRKYEYSAKVNDLVNGYIRTVERSGYNSAEAQQFLDAASRQPELQAIVNQIYGANRVDMLDNPQQGMDWIVRGVFDGLAYNEKNDLKFDQYGAEMRAAARAQAAAKAAGASSNDFGAGITPLNIYSQKERSQAKADIAKYRDYFTQKADGTWELNEKGRKEYKQLPRTNTAGIVSPSGMTKFASFINGIGGVNDNSMLSENDVVNAWTKYYNEHQKESYDATKMTGYRYIPQADDKTLILDLYKGHNNKGKIYTVDYDKKSNSFVEDKQIDIKDITGISDIEMTPIGFIVNASTKNNGSVRLAMPDVGGPRLNWMQQQMFPAIDNMRNDLVEVLSQSKYRDYARDPYTALRIAQSLGYEDDARFIAEQLSNYESGIQTLYNEMPNIYRATDAQVIKR